MTRLCINGRFLTQDLTGVQRYAREVVQGIDDALAARESGVDGLSVELLVPPDTEDLPELRFVATRRVGRRSGHAWEQLDLPRAARGATLFCPANTAPLIALGAREPIVVTLHCLSFLERPESYTWGFRIFYRLLAASVCRAADTVITVSETESRRIEERFPRSRSRLVVVENGAAPTGLQARTSAVELPQRDYVLHVGSFAPLKNLQTLVDALVLANRERSLDLVVVGGSMPGLRAAGVQVPKDLEERVHFEGQVNDPARLGALYRGARCLAMPSRYESSGLPPLEAMACGCPVIVSRLPALIERCADAALYCDPESVADVAAKIYQVLDDAELRRGLIERGRKRSEHFDWQRTARETLEIIRSAGAQTH